MAVQKKKKRISISKKHIRKNLWKRKGYWPALKVFYLVKSLSNANPIFLLLIPKVFLCKKSKTKRWNNLTRLFRRKGLILFII